MPLHFAELQETSRETLLRAIAGSRDVTYLRPPGNIGDRLIHAGTRQLLSGIQYSEFSIQQAPLVQGHTAIVGGCGGWCRPFHAMPSFLPPIEERFERVIVLPSSFDIEVKSVRRWLERTKALVFAREEVSFQQIRELCNSEIALDGAFFFDFSPYKRHAGQGLLSAFRTDREATSSEVPLDNSDISLTCESLDEWIWAIARHAKVRTNRAHVTIAAAMLGKAVEYRPSSYHKVPAIVDYALREFPVTRLTGK